jgi:hypothetical protein
MVVLHSFVALALVLASGVAAAPDPCTKIGGKKWVAPADVRACYKSYKLDDTIRNNVRWSSLSVGSDKANQKQLR